VLPLPVSREKTAFLTDRVIMDNVHVAQEVLHSMGNQNEGKNLMAVKLDMERAFDMMRGDVKKDSLISLWTWLWLHL